MYTYNDLANKMVLITGASGDIGLAICDGFLGQQCTVFALYNSSPGALNELKNNIQKVTSSIFYTVTWSLRVIFQHYATI